MIKYSHFLLLSLSLVSCRAQKNNLSNERLEGAIGIYEGNCMPAPGVPPCEPKPVATIIYITQLSEKFQKNLLIDSAGSAPDGSYAIQLSPGNYSLFLKDGDQVVCPVMQCPDQCYCSPFEIKADSITTVDANLDHATW